MGKHGAWQAHHQPATHVGCACTERGYSWTERPTAEHVVCQIRGTLVGIIADYKHTCHVHNNRCEQHIHWHHLVVFSIYEFYMNILHVIMPNYKNL
ncbi:hypothetical protein EMIT07CA2_50280 [Brevibacillus sp. IT-7CA2]